MPAKYPRAAEWKDADVVGPGLVLIVAIGVAVGVLVFRLTESDAAEAPVDEAEAGVGDEGEPDDPGSHERDLETDDPSAPAARESAFGFPEGSMPVGSRDTPWTARLAGAMGLVIAVAIGAVALALSMWSLISFVTRLISSFDADVAGPNA